MNNNINANTYSALASENCMVLRKLSLLKKFNEISIRNSILAQSQTNSQGSLSNNNISFPLHSLTNENFYSARNKIENYEKNKKIDSNDKNQKSNFTNISSNRDSSSSDSYKVISPHNSNSNFFSSNFVNFCSSSTSQNIFKKSYTLLENEEIIYLNSNTIYIHSNNKQIEGEFILTYFRIIFNPKNPEFFSEEFVLPDLLQIPFTFITSIAKKKEYYKYKYSLKLHYRDRPSMTFNFESKIYWEDYFNYINEMMNPKSLNSYFAFKYNKKYENSENKQNESGWMVYQHLLEYIRMGIKLEDTDCKYRLFIQELHGHLCDTYPNFVYIHKKISNDQLAKVANFRSKKRFPALIWQSSCNNSTLWRSSQAKTGFIDKRNTSDELFFDLLSKETEKFHIYDARPYINALANKMKGMGFENTDNYKNAQLIFCDIENIHCVRQAYNKVRVISQIPL
jgi:hypothetical protein